jgi:uncharacterized protein (UPF0332 family)
VTEAELYLRKARESLASAEADVAAGRYNSTANRAYYAAFQAAIAALIHNDIRPAERGWQHKFVTNQFSSKLVRRRKVLPSALVAKLEDLFRIRVIGDYESKDVSKEDAQSNSKDAAVFVEEVARAMKLNTLREASAEYEARLVATPPSDLVQRRIDELEKLIKTKYPEARFDVVQLGPSDYRLNTFIKARTYRGLASVLKGRTIDILVDDDIWIVVIPHPLSELRNN